MRLSIRRHSITLRSHGEKSWPANPQRVDVCRVRLATFDKRTSVVERARGRSGGVGAGRTHAMQAGVGRLVLCATFPLSCLSPSRAPCDTRLTDTHTHTHTRACVLLALSISSLATCRRTLG
jgi:hypothetical protein